MLVCEGEKQSQEEENPRSQVNSQGRAATQVLVSSVNSISLTKAKALGEGLSQDMAGKLLAFVLGNIKNWEN